ncbi:MAG: DUF4276 family protein [Xenococcus sp. (in: cyanobacteria)]
MNRPIRIGLIAEGETELGKSIPYIKPEDGGKPIPRENEGALHTLIRRELAVTGIAECDFIQRHPTLKETIKRKSRTGHSILDKKYLAQVIITWKPEEVDMIVIVADADDILETRKKELAKALEVIRNNHLDENEQPISDRSIGGLAVRNFETWLLADMETVAEILEVELNPIEDLENGQETKSILENAIAKSNYLLKQETNQRPFQVRWNLASKVDLNVIKNSCPTGYQAFSQSLINVAKISICLK